MKASDKLRLSPKHKIRLALERVGQDHPVAVPAVLGNWKVIPCPDDIIPGTNWPCKTLCTDGRHLWYSVDFVDEQPLEVVICIVGHETGHPLFRHTFRCNGRNHRLWNIACDLAINDNLREWYAQIIDLRTLFDSGSMLPEFGEYADYPRGLSSEAYYDMVVDKVKEERDKMKQQQQEQEGQSDNDQSGNDDGDNSGEGSDPGDEGMGMGDEDSDENGDSEGDNQSQGDAEGQESDGDSDGGDSEGSDEGSESDGNSSSGDSSGDSEGDSTGDSSVSGEPTIDDAINSLLGDKAGTDEELFGTIKEPELGDDENDIKDAERTFNEALQQALVTCKSQGLVAGSLITAVGSSLLEDATHENKMNWRNLLQKFISRLSPGGSTYRRPHRRHGHRRDIIVPANMGRGKSRGLVIVDTSGSMGDSECNEALRQLEQIVGTYPRTTVKMISCDTEVIEGDEWRVTDFPLTEWEGWKGRGGTDLEPALNWANDYRPDWMVILTDMCWEWWECESRIPTIWLGITVPSHYKDKIDQLLPFGVYAEVNI